MRRRFAKIGSNQTDHQRIPFGRVMPSGWGGVPPADDPLDAAFLGLSLNTFLFGSPVWHWIGAPAATSGAELHSG
jgi:hypothetical protein